MKILIVEHNEQTLKTLQKLLTNDHYLVDVAIDGEDAWDVVKLYDYDLLIIDINVPKLDGIRLCQRIRDQGKQMPILLLATKESHASRRSLGLDSGADDFVIEPYEEEILLAKVRALLRRGGGVLPPVLEWRNLQLDPIKHEVTFQNRLLNLTPKEYGLLELFLRNSRRIFSQSVIVELLWSYEDCPGENTIRSHVKSLRKKLKKVGAPDDFIETIYGVGYRLKTFGDDDQPTIVSLNGREAEEQDVHDGEEEETIPVQQVDPDLVDILQQSQGLLNARVSFLEKTMTALKNGEFDENLRQKAVLESHKLVSSLGTFGFQNASESARELETILKREKSFKPEQVQKLNKRVKALRKVLLDCPLPPLPKDFTRVEVQRILIITQEFSLMEKLDIEALKWGIQTEIAINLREAKEMLDLTQPNIILLDLDVTDKQDQCLSFLAEINQRMIPVPVVILTSEESVAQRVKLSSLGGKGFLNKNLLIPDIVKTVINLLEQSVPRESKIMLVDDDPMTLTFVKNLLEPWGLKIKTLDDPEQFWETLIDFSPYLLILDLEMPNLNGLDLCRLVRSDSQWASLPIIFLTVHRDPAIINQAFAVGADDFVNKPLIGSELVTRVINRIERVKLLRRSTEIDPMTGVMHRNRFVEQLIKLFCLAERYNHSICIIVIEIKNLPEVRQEYGPITGEKFLVALGRYFTQKFRREDMVTSWRDGTFVISMYPTTKTAVAKRLEMIFKLLQFHEFLLPNGITLQAHCRYGLSQFPDDGKEIQSLYEVANINLYEEKNHLKETPVEV